MFSWKKFLPPLRNWILWKTIIAIEYFTKSAVYFLQLFIKVTFFINHFLYVAIKLALTRQSKTNTCARICGDFDTPLYVLNHFAALVNCHWIKQSMFVYEWEISTHVALHFKFDMVDVLYQNGGTCTVIGKMIRHK